MAYSRRVNSTSAERDRHASLSRQLTLLGDEQLYPMISAPNATRRNSDANKLTAEDRSVHDWYRFVLSFPPHLVSEYIDKFDLRPGMCLLDPFCGTGTTLVEGKKHGIATVGIEANAMAYFASRVKVDWSISGSALYSNAEQIGEAAHAILSAQGMGDADRIDGGAASTPLLTLPTDAQKLLLSDSISPKPLHKCLLLLELIDRLAGPELRDHFRLALAHTAVFCASNLQFGPEVGVGPAKVDAPVVSAWLNKARSIADDVSAHATERDVLADVRHGDSRTHFDHLADASVDAVFTSPPYPNEKDYTRTTRLESVLLGMVNDKAQLQAMKRTLLRSNTRNVYKGDGDDAWIEDFPAIHGIAEQIENRRIELGKTSGFERMYARVTKLYFGGMARHLAEMRRVLKPGARLGYVVGDQASYLRVMIRTGQLLAEIAASQGYETLGIDLFRTRLATATKEQLREEVVILRWPG